MPASTATPVGREREIAMLRAFLEAPPASGALLIEGEPGIGKTTLLSLGVAEARDAGYRVLRAAPAATETKLSFSALGDLLENTGPGLLEALPPPQRRALGGALLRVDVEGRPPDRRTVSVAVLEVIRSMAAEGPVLIAIDDIQWLDRPSARVLEYTARRLRTERVAFLLSRRTGDSTDPSGLLGALGPDRLRHLELTGLSVGALGRVLANQQGPVLNRPLLLKVRRTSGGNPLFAQEIVRALRRDGQPTPSHSSLPIPDSLRAAVRDRVGELPAGAREAVLVVAALASPTRNVVRDALGPRAESSVAAAVDADVVTLENGRVLLAHPLIGSVLYDEATETERRSVHARLAETVADPEEKARHLALAATGPDAAVAGALRRAAGIARSRGAPEAAAELSDRAVELTPPEETDVRNELTVEAADHHFASGDADRAWEALERLAAALPPGPERARILWRLARIRFITESLGQAGAILRQSLDEAGDDVALRAHVEQALAFTEMVGGNLPLAQQHARSAVALAARADDAAVTALALSRLATTEFILGMGLDRPSFERSIRLEGALDPDIPIEWRPAYNFAGVLMYADDFAGARGILLALLRGVRDRGEEGALPSILFLMSELECRAGDWSQADRYAAEALETSHRSGQDLVRAWALYARSLVDAHLGDVEASRRAAEEGLAFAQRTGAVSPVAQITSVMGFLALSAGDAEAAHGHLAPLSDMVAAIGVGEPGVVRFLPDDIEALIALGENERAGALVDQFDVRARALDRPSALAAAARCRGLQLAGTGDVPGGLVALDEALRQHERVRTPFERARTLLVRGQVARRGRKWGDARRSLEEALAVFEDLGAALWADRARAELPRIGGRPPAPEELTPSEHQTAQHAAAGLTTKQVAEAMFVSPKTVEVTLTRVYRKLGIRSRAELAARIASDPPVAR